MIVHKWDKKEKLTTKNYYIKHRALALQNLQTMVATITNIHKPKFVDCYSTWPLELSWSVDKTYVYNFIT